MSETDFWSELDFVDKLALAGVLLMSVVEGAAVMADVFPGVVAVTAIAGASLQLGKLALFLLLIGPSGLPPLWRAAAVVLIAAETAAMEFAVFAVLGTTAIATGLTAAWIFTAVALVVDPYTLAMIFAVVATARRRRSA